MGLEQAMRYGIGVVILGMMVALSGGGQAQSLQRSTAQPLGAVGVPPKETGPAAPVTPGPATTAPPKPAAGHPAPERFPREVDAKTACGSQPVVWVNTRSKTFVASGTSRYGKTSRGAFMCRDTAMSGGFKPARP